MRRMRLFLLLVAASTTSAREIAITIDDLPRGGDGIRDFEATRQMTTKLLEPFRVGRLPVTGFVNECRRPEEEVEAILQIWKAAGAEMGNHTCSHPDLNSVPLAEYVANIEKGEPITTKVFGKRAKYFRHPFLHAGKDAETRQGLEKYLREHDYTVAPVTLDASDYMFAAAYTASAPDAAEKVRKEYVAHTEAIFDFFEKRAVEVTGHEVRQILLIHANQLNADAMPDLLAMMKRRGYQVVSLERALQDKAYSLPDTYLGTNGISWIHRWSMTKGMPRKGEPDEPAWILELYNSRRPPVQAN